MRTKLFIYFFILSSLGIYAQTIITGVVSDESGPIPSVNIKIEKKAIGTISDFDGNFTLKTNENPPFNIIISSIGYISKIIEVTSKNQKLEILLEENNNSLDEVVVSASRTPERIMESPVSIERMDVRAIKNSTSATFYDSLENLKGVDINTSSLTFKSVNTRGFATFANNRFMQLVDGMDNSSPALNFSLGNLLGMSELDVNTVELLPGASSALYGANAFNGILFMTSKNPFDHTGVSAYVKTGLTSQEAAGDHGYYDLGIRAAYKFSNKLAVKASFSYLQGEEWWASDYRDIENPGATRNNFSGYDGLNTYGDEVKNVINFDEIVGTPEGTFGEALISRTGYEDTDIVDTKAESIKVDIAAHYRPFENDFEIIWNSKIGKGNTIFQGANRYSLKNFFMQQHKLEIKNDNFFVRGYTTAEKAGDSYDSRFAAININERWKSTGQWFNEYIGTYIGALSQGLDTNTAHVAARQTADNGRLIPGTTEFNNALETVISDGDFSTGAKFIDNSKLYHMDINYNFAHLIDAVDIQVGGSYREYVLNSEGTIYTDYDAPIRYDEYGAYIQLQKKLLDDHLKLTGSIRYDKSKNFDGNFSPRISAVYSVDERKKHNIRGSFQTGFRNPTTQDQYIAVDVGTAILLGGAPDNPARLERNNLDGTRAYSHAYSASSVTAFANTGDVSLLQQVVTEYVKPEKVSAFELGYRGFIADKIVVDLSGYYNSYKDFIANKNVVAVNSGEMNDGTAIQALVAGDTQVYQLYANSNSNVSSYGASLGLNTKIGNGFKVGLNYTYAKLDYDANEDQDFDPQFNTPEHKLKASLGHDELFKNFGFNINWRWNDSYLWQASFGNGQLPANHIIDAQINYNLPSIKSIFKMGGSNLTSREYVSAIGSGAIGSIYYLSWTINP